MRPKAEGLESIPAPVMPFVFVQDWPFPVLLKGIEGYGLFGRREIYDIDSLWNLTKVFTASKDPTSRWNPLDYATYNVLIGGGITLLRDSSRVYHEATLVEFPDCSSGCDCRSQIVLCDVAEGTNWLKWSRIGDINFLQDVSNVAGSRPMPFKGPVWQLIYIDLAKSEGLSAPGTKHDYGVVAYGQRGIAYLQAVDNPAPTFKLDPLTDFGIATRFACGGDREKHLFIDERGYLRTITNKGLAKLDYLEFLQPLITGDIVITRDDTEDQWWISDGETAYVFGQGLCSTDYCISDGFSDSGVFIAAHNNPTRLVAEVTTDTFDMEVKARKSLETLILRIETDGVVSCAVDWRNEPSETFNTSPWFPVIRGIGHPRVTAVDFRVKLKVEGYTYIKIHDLDVRWKLTDKTNIRGVYAYGPPNSRAGQL